MDNFADIEGPVRIGLIWLVLMGLAALLLLSAIGAIVAYLRKRAKTTPTGPREPERTPLEIAIARLEHLKAGETVLDAEPFTVEVADIVRDYLEASLQIPAREQTSEEFLLALQASADLPDILSEHMPAFLEQCDRVKFAQQRLAETQREDLLETAGTVVRETDAHFNTQRDPEPEQTLSRK